MPPTVVLHAHPRPRQFDHRLFENTLRAALPPQVPITMRPPLLETVPTAQRERRAWRIACTRVLDPMRSPHTRVTCSASELADELGVLSGQRPPTGRPPPEGVLYDGAQLAAVARDAVPPGERRLDAVHLVLTDRLFGTFQRNDGRYHARVVLASTPHLLSSSGIVEAPARPRGYYAALAQGQAGLGPGQTSLEAALDDEIVVHGDPRIPRLLVGYALQAFFWQVFGEAFCAEPACCLFNAHWQHELLAAQGDAPVLCDRHDAMRAALGGA